MEAYSKLISNFQQLLSFSFGRPDWWILLFVVLAVFLFFYSVGLSKRKLRLQKVFGQEKNAKNFNFKKFLLFFIGLIFIVLAILQPRLGYEEIDVKHRGVDVILAVDVSKSMLTQDVGMSRLALVKIQIQEFLQNQTFDRVGIVAFAGNAYAVCPLTYDFDAAMEYLDLIKPDLIPLGGTDFNAALAVSLNALTQGGSGDSQGQVVLLMTDGEDQYDLFSEQVKKFQEKNIHVYPLGFGSVEGGPIPDDNGQFKTDENGKIIISKLNPETLDQIAKATGGKFVRVKDALFSLSDYYRKTVRSGLSDSEKKSTKERIWHERFQWFLSIGIVLLLVELFLKENKMFAVILFLFFQGPLKAANWDQGEKLYDQKKFEDAANFFEKNNNAPQGMYGLGASKYRLGQYDEAEKDFSQAAEDFEKAGNLPGTKQSLFNLGNTHVAKGELEKAAADYEKALKIAPDDKFSKENLEWVKKKIEQKNKQQQKNGEKKPDENKPDQENNQQEKKSEQSDKDKQNDQKNAESTQKNDPKKTDSTDKNISEKQNEKPSKKPQEKEPEPTQEKIEIDKVLRSVEDRPAKFFKPQGNQETRQPAKDW